MNTCKRVEVYRIKKANVFNRLSSNPKVMFFLLCLSSILLTRFYYLQHLFELKVEEEKLNWRHYLTHNVPTYNPSKYVGRGIVFTTYGPTVNITFASINILRDKGCKLPVEVWHFDGELSGNEINRLQEDSQTKVKSLTSYLDGESYQGILKTFSLTKRNYQVKTASIINSGFQEVLYIDSDNVVVEDPTSLFDTQEYKETGALFWPDYFMNTVHPVMYDIFGIEKKQEWEQEAGQLVIDKGRKVKHSHTINHADAFGSTWHALHLSLYMQNKNDFYFKLVFGDKDTFKFAWEATKTPYHMITHYPGAAGFNVNGYFCGHTIVQFSPTKTPRKPLFMHINLLKQKPDSYRTRGSTFQTYKTYYHGTIFAKHRPKFSIFLRPFYKLICIDFQDNNNGDGMDGKVLTDDFGKLAGIGFEDRFFDLVSGVGVNIMRTAVPE